MIDDQTRLSDLVEERQDIAGLREVFKDLAAEAREQGKDWQVDDVLALSRKNDTCYIQPSDIEKAEWFAELYEAEGRPEVHPRGFHYALLGKGYETRHGDAYTNTTKCWKELQEGAFWARVLGLVDPDRIGDEKNDDPTPTAFASVSDPVPAEDVAFDASDAAEDANLVSPFEPTKLDVTLEAASLTVESVGEYVDAQAKRIVEAAFRGVEYRRSLRQPYYIEIWAEKSGVIPEELAAEYGATIRPAGGGEMSFNMCREAVTVASERDQNLAVVMVTDYDPKGIDMGKSAGRKISVEAALEGIEAEVVHAAVTKEQAQENGLPGTPAKEPRGLEDGNPGAMAYETQKRVFREHAGQHPVEIQSFATRAPEAYREAIRDAVEPYYDESLDERIEDSVRTAQQDAYGAVREHLNQHSDDIEAVFSDLQDALDEYQDDLEDDFDVIREGMSELVEREKQLQYDAGVDRCAGELDDELLDVDLAEPLDDVEIDLPAPEAEGVEDALLDTRRSLLEQLRWYQEYDVRYGASS